jgi:hypothetical protein
VSGQTEIANLRRAFAHDWDRPEASTLPKFQPSLDWLGEPFDPGRFDLQAANATLRGLKLQPDPFLLNARALFLVHPLSEPPPRVDPNPGLNLFAGICKNPIPKAKRKTTPKYVLAKETSPQ